MSTADLVAELQEPLSKLPGYDARGLQATADGRRVIALDRVSAKAGNWWWVSTLYGVPAQVPAESLVVDFTERAARDRASLTLALRYHMPSTCTAPVWRYDWGSWLLVSGTETMRFSADDVGANVVSILRLARLDGTPRPDGAKLVDGARLVDAVALVRTLLVVLAPR